MKIFVMAQGEGSRWREHTYVDLPSKFKQLTPLGDETIITRTLRQIKSCPDVTVIADGYFAAYMPQDVKLVYFRFPGSLLFGIQQTIKWMDDRNIILLGDVVYSNSLIEKILSSEEGYMIHGRKNGNPVTGKKARELFALVVSHHFIPVLDQQINNCLVANKNAKLWDLYTRINTPLLVDDYTDDLDSPEEYLQFWSKLKEAALRDDNEN